MIFGFAELLSRTHLISFTVSDLTSIFIVLGLKSSALVLSGLSFPLIAFKYGVYYFMPLLFRIRTLVVSNTIIKSILIAPLIKRGKTHQMAGYEDPRPISGPVSQDPSFVPNNDIYFFTFSKNIMYFFIW
uniref:Uncharacterized protein n=1 Tax=Nelumbo nucifera TaxID=4432 RepID=A0A822Y296_NELNU|nr:TPA_asm: hypothetical protein HUJ06_029482 [Nelumbo nucifera]